ncbi:hypothetical protein ACQJBY_009755 [Aegilops geniculata]
MRAAAPVAVVHSPCIGNLLKSSFANCIASPAGAPAIWPFPFAVWSAVSAAAAISSGTSAVERRFLIQQQRRRLLSIYQRKEHYLIQRQRLYEQCTSETMVEEPSRRLLGRCSYEITCSSILFSNYIVQFSIICEIVYELLGYLRNKCYSN